MPDPTRINLTYRGKDVDDGTMAIGLVADVLDGFSAAYRKTAAFLAPSDETLPQLRVAAPREGSFDLMVVASMVAAQNPQLFHLALGEFTRRVGEILGKVIDLKKLLKGQTYNTEVKGDNNVILNIGGDVHFETSREVFEFIDGGMLDRDLAKIVRPLQKGRIDEAELAVDDEVQTVITSEDRQFFTPGAATETTVRPDELIGALVSTNKEQKRGTFRMQNGRTVPYHYVGESDEDFLREFSYKGVVRVAGEIKKDENGKPIHLSIRSVQRMQTSLFPDAH
ncbi:MAG: hypothetical protein ACJ72H_03110 [Candidatus Sulfotelmatobacter sp.]|jgi:hypothetical protein